MKVRKRLTTEDFIARSVAVHGDKYDYSDAIYVNSTTKIIITCSIHGQFTQRPPAHMKGGGCEQCGGSKRLTTDDFILRSRAKHGDKYNYSESVYVNSITKLTIICPIHGRFEQNAMDHLVGKGCRKCGGSEILSTDIFLDRAEKVHGDTYIYSSVEYVNIDTHIKIICKKHGEFMQTPYKHLLGRGCMICSGKEVNTAEFKKSAKDIHGDTYCYSLSEYKCNKSLIKIICKTHGVFKQSPNKHLSGRGCNKCGRSRTAKALMMDHDEYIRRCRNVHGNLYLYGNVKYSGMARKISIICAVHGEFSQEAWSHLRGSGCPKCPLNRDQPTSLYLLKSCNQQVKIGYSIEPELRLSQLQRDQPFSAKLLKTWTLPDTPAAREAESAIHKRLEGFNAGLSGFDGATEWFDTTPEYAIPIISGIVEQYKTGGRA